MSRSPQNEYLPEVVSAPGETLREILDERGMTQTQLADRTGRPKKTINEIVKGKAAITPETALQFELVLGIPADFWNQRESNYREYLARKEEQERLSDAIDWLQELPVNQLAKFGWVQKYKNKALQVREMLRFFGVASPQQWRDVHSVPQAAFRKPATLKGKAGSIASWLRAGVIRAENIQCEPFNKDEFINVLLGARRLTKAEFSEASVELAAKCSQVGVAVVFVPQIPGAGVSGATRWLTKEKAIIQLSILYKTSDHLWFTFFHEAGHIILHGKKEVFLETKSPYKAVYEDEANRFASELLIPKLAYQDFLSREVFTKKAVIEFANRIEIDPGILVGRLQHDRKILFRSLNNLKTRLEWSEPSGQTKN